MHLIAQKTAFWGSKAFRIDLINQNYDLHMYRLGALQTDSWSLGWWDSWSNGWGIVSDYKLSAGFMKVFFTIHKYVMGNSSSRVDNAAQIPWQTQIGLPTFTVGDDSWCVGWCIVGGGNNLPGLYTVRIITHNAPDCTKKLLSGAVKPSE